MVIKVRLLNSKPTQLRRKPSLSYDTFALAGIKTVSADIDRGVTDEIAAIAVQLALNLIG